MSTYKSGDQLALDAMKKEHKRLCRVAEKAKAECDECCNIGSELVAIHNEFSEIVSSKEHGEHVIKKLEALKRRRNRAERILKKSVVTLSDKQIRAEIEANALLSEIQRLEFRIDLRRSA